MIFIAALVVIIATGLICLLRINEHENIMEHFKDEK